MLLDLSLAECITALVVRQVREPMEERRIAGVLPRLTEIGDGTSRVVRQQYEENPYPRWVVSGPPGRPPILGDRAPDYALDVLIVGCGTGRFAVDFARDSPKSRFLAIDLSLASLSYAKRMADQFGLANIEFAQADIMHIGLIGRQFDFIDVSGVLHHLADPWAGWRTLLPLLRPGGHMQVGLYSKLARLPVVAGRSLIAARGYRSVPEDIRKCRDEIATSGDPVLRSLTSWPDFFTTSNCRDLLFHVQEHRTTLPEIKSFLISNKLQFAGFYLAMPFWRRFAARFPDRSAADNLDCWHAFEIESPDTFEGMYLFNVRKPGISKALS
jgi:SAM-dependent methyltransferase